MLTIPTKQGEKPVDPLWVKEWNDLYLGVDAEILKAISWLRDNPHRLKKQPRRFLGNWIRKSCPLRPVVRQAQIVHDPKPEVNKETVSGYLQMMKERVTR